MGEAVVLGVGMTKTGKFPDRTLKDLSREAIEQAISYAGISKEQIQAAYVGNVAAGIITGQHAIRGQVVLRPMGISDISIVNIEDACATGSATFHMGWLDVVSGFHDCVLVVGMEKLFHTDKAISFAAVNSTRDVEVKEAPAELRGSAVDMFAEIAREWMATYGLTREQIARVSSKNHYNGSLNPRAQYQKTMSVEEILAARVISDPLTIPMIAPIGDGAAAAIICSAEFARRYTTHPVFVSTSVLRAGKDIGPGEPKIRQRTSREAYERSGIGARDIGIFEVNDATAFTEIEAYYELGLCDHNEIPAFIERGSTELTGPYPVNSSGGLECKGHPFAATGIAQVAEITWQMRGEAGQRQAANRPKTGLAEIHGGDWSPDTATACGITILKL
jgi:acetyl-CoA acetyltransferase